MQTYEPMAGTHINRACEEAIAMAIKSGNAVQFRFNDIALTADMSDDPGEVARRYDSIMESRREKYRKSPEGIAAAARNIEEIAKAQADVNKAIVALPEILRTDNHLADLVKWAARLAISADRVGVTWNKMIVYGALVAAGYIENEYVGQEPAWFTTQERMGRYIIGQVMNCLATGMGPHPITETFAEKFSKLPA